MYHSFTALPLRVQMILEGVCQFLSLCVTRERESAVSNTAYHLSMIGVLNDTRAMLPQHGFLVDRVILLYFEAVRTYADVVHHAAVESADGDLANGMSHA